MEIAHLGHLRISARSHTMLKKVSAIIEAFKERADLTRTCVICFIVEERMLMLEDKTDGEGTVRRMDTIDRTHYWKGQETQLQQHEWSKKRFRIPSLPSPILFPNICLPHRTLYLQVRAVGMKPPADVLTLCWHEDEISPEWHIHQATYCLDLLWPLPFSAV